MGDYFTIPEVANEVHVSDQTVIRWIKAGKLQFFQVSERRRLIAKADLRAFLDNKKVCPPPKRIDKSNAHASFSPKCSLITSGERKAEMDVKSLRKEIARLCRQ